jgi:hypothetical protein
MQRLQFDEILESLDKLDSWLISLGIQPKTDRWHQAAKTVRAAKEQRERVERGETRLMVENYVHGLFEAIEAHEIFRAFSGEASQPLKEKVQRALSGPIAPPDEQPRNSAGRNAMFELSLAADWKNHGLSVEVGEPDIFLYIAGSPFLVECKRPFSGNSIWPNIEDSAKQLGRDLDRPENCLARGIVAISLGRALTQNNLICCAQVGEAKQAVGKALRAMIAEHQEEWRLKTFRHFHPRIVAVMFHLAVPWDLNGETLAHMAGAHFFQAGIDHVGWRLLIGKIGPLYN